MPNKQNKKSSSAKSKKRVVRAKVNRPPGSALMMEQGFWRKNVIAGLLLFVVPFLLYAASFNYGFVLDDVIVLSENSFVKEGISGIGDILSNDVFTGYLGGQQDLVEGGRYRPLSLVTFTIDMTLLPDFSQVQSDDVINNLSAFETIFDEQRTFFQEGVDLFSQGQLFYSRRIGSRVQEPGAANNSLQDGEEITDDPEKSRLLNAFKISGRTKKDVGIGVFNAIEGRSFAEIKTVDGTTREVQNDPLSNYNIFVLEKNLKNNRIIYGIKTNVSRTDG